MSHVVSSQPSSTSPYQPTEIQDTANGKNQPRLSTTIETHEGQEDCCFRANKTQGRCFYYCCNFLSSICGGIRSCTEKCCDSCADCLTDCCEDDDMKNKNRSRPVRYGRTGTSYDHNNYNDDNTWVVGATQQYNTSVGVLGSNDDADVYRSSIEDRPTDCYVRRDSGTHHSTVHHSSCHDTGYSSVTHHSSNHHSSSHDTGGHHDYGSSTCHVSSDTGGGGWDSGGGCDSGGGGDSGGGCDSGGGGGGCDD